MSRALLILNGDEARSKAIAWVRKAPINSRVEFKAPRRSIPQNDKMWAALGDIASQLSWHGRKLTPNQWKKIFLRKLSTEFDMVPNIDNNGYVDIGESSSDLGKQEMSDLIELIYMFGAEHQVMFQREAEMA